jgi:hypothetical protein
MRAQWQALNFLQGAHPQTPKHHYKAPKEKARQSGLFL